MDGKQEFDFIDKDAKDLGIFYIISRFWLPLIVAIILLVIGYFIFKDIITEFIDQNLPPQSFAIVLVLLTIILVGIAR